MTRRAPSEIYGSLRAAGFSVPRAITMTAIALGESGGDDAAVGDVGLEDNIWGPSYGLFQIRTVKAETGHGTDRDINALAGNDTAQARAAYDISNQGSNFTPWTVYTTGKYQQFIGQAQAAASGDTATASMVAAGPFPTFGPGWLPWNWPSDAGNAAVNSALSGTRSIVLEALAVVLGLGLVGAGLAKAFAPQLKSAAHTAAKVGEVAAL